MIHSEHEATSETTLVAQAGSGDTGAFEALHHRHAESAWHLACAVTGDPSLAAAAVPEGFAKVFTALRAGRTSPENAFRPQLLAATRDAALDLRRAQPDAGVEHVHDAPAVDVAFRGLPERWRSVLWLTGVEHLSPAEAAPIVGLAPDATEQLLDRARGGLREQFLQAHLSRTGDRNCARAVVRLGAYASGTLIEADAEKLERHLDLCAECSDRFAGVHDIDAELARLVIPTPILLLADSRDAWTAALATPKHRTATGLSPRTEKVLAGFSVLAAAAGVLGAALLGGGDVSKRSEQAAPKASLATESTPADFDLESGLDIPSFGSGTSSAGTGSSLTGAAGSAGGLVAGAGSSGSTAGDATGDGSTSDSSSPVAPRTDPGPIAAEGPGSGGGSADEPVISVGTEVAGIPIAVEIGTDPGVTVGPVTLGSEPEPEPEAETESADEPSAPLEPVVEPVEQVVETVTEPVSGTLPGL